MKASTKRADEICDYYMKMENIMHRYTKEKMEDFLKHSQIKEADLVKQLELATEKNKHTKETSGFVYIATNLKESHKKIHKVGIATDDKARESSMNTCEMDGCFKILVKFHTQDRILAEKLIHTHLTRHKFHYNKEFFTIDLDQLISICKVYTKLVDQMSSMTMDEYYAKLVNIDGQCMMTVNNNNSVTTNNNPITINVSVLPEQLKELKYFDIETYKKFIEENIVSKNDSYSVSEEIRNAFNKWLTNNNLKPNDKIDNFYINNPTFKSEFKDVLEYCLNIKQNRIYNTFKSKHRITGFKNISLLDKKLDI
jgi:hypothetical protein